MSIVNKCTCCGKKYTIDNWKRLKYRGHSTPIDDGEKPDTLEFRDCACGTTLAVWLDDDGRISADQGKEDL